MNKLPLLVAAMLAASTQAQFDKSKAMPPPLANKIAHKIDLHGEEIVDDYFWLREKTNPEVIKYLNLENAYTQAIMVPTKAFQAKLYKEVVGRIKETDLSVPAKRTDGYYYYSRTIKGKQYPIYCRRYGNMKAKEQVILDMNALAKGKKFLGLGGFDISDDGNMLAYSVDFTGFRQYTLHIKDLRTNKVLPDRREKTVDLLWAGDNKTIFYTTEDAAKRPYRVYRHKIGAKTDPMVFEEKDALYTVWPSKSSDKEYVFITSGSSEDTVTRYIPAKSPTKRPAVILPLEKDHEYYVDHRLGKWYIRTNKRAKNFKLVTAPVEDPTKWRTIIPARKGIKLENVELFRGRFIAWERKNALMQMKVTDFGTGKSHYMTFPESAYSAEGGGNDDFNTDVYRFTYASFLTPGSVYDYNVKTQKKKLLKQTEVKGGFDKTKYETKRLFATASDGTKVPLSIMYRKGLKLNGQNPVYLTGYGSYGAPSDVYFSSNRLSLVDRGVIYALAHIRGGGDMGEEWHDNGKMMHKKNTFTDFIACAEHLVKTKYTTPKKMVCSGGSAGGLLIGAVLNMRPDLFKAAILDVPFVDVINTMLDETLPLTVGEFLEWGNPKVKAEYDYIKTYSPYENIRDVRYPDLLINTSLNDSQVLYHEPAKYTARMRAVRSDDGLVMLKTNMDAGHGGASGRYDSYKELAFDYAFILWELGIRK